MSIICIDFDGTIVDHEYPAIGKEKLMAVATLKDLIIKGHEIILWTCREDEKLQEAVQWLMKNGVFVEAVNENIDKTLTYGKHKVFADVYFDDRSFPPFPGWAAVRNAFQLDLEE